MVSFIHMFLLLIKSKDFDLVAGSINEARVSRVDRSSGSAIHAIVIDGVSTCAVRSIGQN